MERLVDRIVDWYVGRRISGWNTKIGAAATTLLAVITVLGALVEPLQLAADGHYSAAVKSLAESPQLWVGLGFFGITKQTLGVRVAQDKLATGELEPEARAAAVADVLEEERR